MKTFRNCLAMVLAVVFLQPVMAQKDASNVQAATPSPVIEAISMAQKIAQYGYDVQNPLCLVTAAQLLAATPTTKFVPESEVKGKADPQLPTKAKTRTSAEMDVNKLIQDALAMSKNDPAIKALTDKISVSRGPIGGPRVGTTRVEAGSVDSYRVTFRGQEKAEIGLSGDGDTDLDLYVYDENENLIVKDDDGSDRCYVTWSPKWTGLFIIRVRNRGSIYNRYTIAMQ